MSTKGQVRIHPKQFKQFLGLRVPIARKSGVVEKIVSETDE
jgi:hypothetical protein